MAHPRACCVGAALGRALFASFLFGVFIGCTSDAGLHLAAEVTAVECKCHFGACIGGTPETCVSFERTGDESLTLHVQGFSGPCGTDGDLARLWQADATETAPGALDLHVYFGSESATACGSCLMEWDVSLTPPPIGPTVDLTVTTRHCTSSLCDPSDPWTGTLDINGTEGPGTCSS